MRKSRIEIRKRLMELKQARLKLEAPTAFSRFLGYSNPKYEAEWFHILIANYCQMLLEGKIKNLMVFMPPQHGKEIADSQLVPTPFGFKQHGKLCVGDYVFGRDGKPVRVLALSPKVKSEYVVTFSDGAEIACHGNHEWLVYDRSRREERVCETKYLATQKIASGTPNTRGHRYRFQVDANVCVEYAPQNVMIDPYTLGGWLGDGCATSSIMHIGGDDVGIIGNSPYDFHENSGSTTRRFYSSTFHSLLKQQDQLNNKHIPSEYIFNTVEVRKQLIAGLIDTDGYVYQKNGRVTISNTNKGIIDDAATILRSLGQSVVITSYEPRKGGHGIVGKQTVYQLCFNPTMNFPTVLERKRTNKLLKRNKRRAIVKIERKKNLEYGRCIQVEGGVYLVGETFIPTHNSEIISRNFPAWALGKNPDLKIVGCSYSSDLAEQFSRSIQRTIDSKEYQSIFPETYLSGSNIRTDTKGFLRNVDIFETVGHRGFYKAVGVGGSLTGTPVDIAIIDDPVKDANEANSTTYRQRVWDWYNTVLSTRLHNDSKQLFIMTRWHEDDLAGRILKAEPQDWTVLSIPAICETEHDGNLHSPRHIGDALWENRHSKRKLEKQKARAPREFSALHQQHPTIEGGNIVKRDWFRRISMAEFIALRFNEPMHFYLDTAYNKKKKNQDNDPSGILAACRIRNNIYLYDAQQVWKEMPDLLRFLPDYMEAHEGNKESILHIEPKANGISVVQMLREISTLNVKETPTPTDDKEVRLRAVSPRIECGRVYIVEGSWNDDFLDEVCGFPSQPHDEFVDILGYAINDLYEEDSDVDFDSLDKGMFGL